MNVGFVGLGKLGLPLAVALSKKHLILGWDVDPELRQKRPYPHRELGPMGFDDFQQHLDAADVIFAGSIKELVEKSEIIFVAVQTPHGQEYEGITRVPETRADFDYAYLKLAVKEIVECMWELEAPIAFPNKIIIVVSTVLPGTMRREILPIINELGEGILKAFLVYNPAFPAMGTCMGDFLNPEFVLLGGSDEASLAKMEAFYHDFHNSRRAYGKFVPIRKMSVESAELTKVAYNLFITMKIGYANFLGEVCHKVPGCDVDDVTDALKQATDRLLSPRYLASGFSDSGPCHPRDCIAMSWLAKELNLSHDLFGQLMEARESHAEWIVDLVCKEAGCDRQTIKNGYRHWPDPPKMQIVILGKAYKPETNLTAGSAGMLCANLLRERGIGFIHYDSFVDGTGFEGPLRELVQKEQVNERFVFLIATKHECFKTFGFPQGSVVIDPFRYIPDRPGVKVVRVGVGA